MKKNIAILTLTLFTGAFAKDNVSKVEKVHSLTKTEKVELQNILELRRERLFDR